MPQGCENDCRATRVSARLTVIAPVNPPPPFSAIFVIAVEISETSG